MVQHALHVEDPGTYTYRTHGGPVEGGAGTEREGRGADRGLKGGEPGRWRGSAAPLGARRPRWPIKEGRSRGMDFWGTVTTWAQPHTLWRAPEQGAWAVLGDSKWRAPHRGPSGMPAPGACLPTSRRLFPACLWGLGPTRAGGAGGSQPAPGCPLPGPPGSLRGALLHCYSRPALERSQHTSARSREQRKRLELLRKPLSTALERSRRKPPAAGSIPAASTP